jgi:hypothetical protein
MLYAIVARTTWKDSQGWTHEIDHPTFFLDANVQWIRDAGQAERIARAMLSDSLRAVPLEHWPKDIEWHVSASPV